MDPLDITDKDRLLELLAQRRQGKSRIIDEACHYFTMYHAPALIERRGDSFEVGQTAGLYYYSNRARGYGWSRRLQRSA